MIGTLTAHLGKARGWRHPHVAALGLFTCIVVGIYWPVLVGTRSLITNGPWSQPLFVIDPLAGGPITAPLTRLVASSWRHLHLPVVDPFQGFGIPLLADQGVPVYPPQVIAHLLFPSNYSIWLVVNLVALAFGVYLLARAFGQRFFGAMAAGVLAALAGAAPPNVNMSMLNPLAVLPFVLVALRFALDPESPHRRVALAGTATSVALLCLSGFPEVLPLMAVVIVVYAVALLVRYGTWRVRPLRLVGTAASAAAGVVVGSIGVLPTLSAVGAGTGSNGTTRYLSHLPNFWLSTLTFPTVTGRALNQAPQDLGNPVTVLGTALLVLVVVLAFLLACRRNGRHTRWYVFPSVAFVVFGVLAFADVGHVLGVMNLPLFDRITSDRLVQFAWWIPLCLLLGAVVSTARVLEWKDVVVAALAAAAFDVYVFERYRQALAANHVAASASVVHAPLVAAVVVVVFVAALISARWLGTGVAGLLMALVVLASCIYDLPTNFAPARFDRAVTTVKVPGLTGSAGGQLVYFGNRQLPTRQYSVQVYGPIVPLGYRVALSGLFSSAETSGLGPFYGAFPTLAALTLTPRALSVLRSFGVDLLVLPSRLSGVGLTSVPSCGKGGEGSAGGRGAVCFLGEEPTPAAVGYSPTRVYVYRILGADPLVLPTATLVAEPSTVVAENELWKPLSTSVTRMPSEAFLTTNAAHVQAARGVRGMARRATTQRVWITLHSRTAGTAVLRESYEPGMHATVDGRSATATPVDGGLWTAVGVGPGTSHVVLDYATTSDLVELGLGAGGLALLAVLWGALAVSGFWRRRRSAALTPTPPQPMPAQDLGRARDRDEPAATLTPSATGDAGGGGARRSPRPEDESAWSGGSSSDGA